MKLIGLTFTLLWLIALSFYGAETQTETARDNDELYNTVKALYDTINFEGDFSKKAFDADKTLRDMAPEIMPELKRLFHEETNNSRKSGYIGTMFGNSESVPMAVEFVKAELAKPLAEWNGTYWVSMALGGLEKNDPTGARWACLRVLDHEDEIGIVATALFMLKRIGEPADLAELRRFRERRERNPEGRVRLDTLERVDEAIAAITSRSPRADPVVNSTPAAAKPAAVDVPDARPREPSKAAQATATATPPNSVAAIRFPWAWALLAAVVLLALGYGMLRRS